MMMFNQSTWPPITPVYQSSPVPITIPTSNARLCHIGQLYGDEYALPAAQATLRLNYSQQLLFPTNEATPQGTMPEKWARSGSTFRLIP